MFINNYYDIELNDTDNLATVSSKITVKLKPHQLTALNKAIEMEKNGIIRYKFKNNELLYSFIPQIYLHEDNNIIEVSSNVGIFGDIVGYGKTLIALALIASNNDIYINRRIVETYNNNKNYNYFTVSTNNHLINNKIIRATLVIVPRGPVYIQWQKMINTNTTLKVLYIDNYSYIRNYLPKYDGTNEDDIINFFNNYDLILIKNTTLKLLFDNYNNIINKWLRIIIDEAHDIINKLRVNIHYQYMWMISATYDKLFDKIKHSTTSLIVGKDMFNNSDYNNLIIVRNNYNYIKSSFILPEPIEKFHICKLSNNINVIKTFISNNVLDKINANDIAGAIKELGGKNETEEDIIELVSREMKRELHNKELERNYINTLDITNDDKTIKLKKINLEIQTCEEKINDLTNRITSKTCSICMELIINPILIECTHIFCGSCLLTWLKTNKNCPCCRNNINSIDKLTAIVNTNNKIEKEEILSKEDTLLKIINSKPNGKFLIFSKNENSFDKIKEILMNYKYDMLKGNTSHMINILNKFKNGEINIIFLNTQYAGSGIDISDATDIIIFHKMGSDKEQAIGRAQRVGRTTELYIHNLCYEHEL
jgi:superfamily II DNA or RNA helicase